MITHLVSGYSISTAPIIGYLDALSFNADNLNPILDLDKYLDALEKDCIKDVNLVEASCISAWSDPLGYQNLCLLSVTTLVGVAGVVTFPVSLSATLQFLAAESYGVLLCLGASQTAVEQCRSDAALAKEQC